MEDLASGNPSWREADTNTLFLACFGAFIKRLEKYVARPLWFLTGTIFAGMIAYIVLKITQ